MNKRFIKKNLFLIGVLALTAVIVVVLLVKSVLQTVDMVKSGRKTKKMREDNKVLMRQQPPAVQENVEKIQKDIDGYQAKSEALKLYFGQTLNPALEAFCKKAGVDKKALCERFKTFREKNNDEQRQVLYRDFKDYCCKVAEGEEKPFCASREKWDQAMEAFKQEAQKTTLEKIESTNFEEIFLSSLGLPRTLNNDQVLLENFSDNMRRKAIDLLKEQKISVTEEAFDGEGVSGLKTVADFNDGNDNNGSVKSGKREKKTSNSRSSRKEPVGGPADSGPNQRGGGNRSDAKEVLPSDVVRQWEVTGDLVQRMRDAKIEELKEFSYGKLTGAENGQCTFYSYEIKMRGSQAAIQKFMNSVGEAYQQNRVYVIRNFSIRKSDDQAQALVDFAQGKRQKVAETESKSSAEAGAPSRRSGRKSRGKNDDAPMLDNATSQQSEEQDLYVETGEYGEIIIGSNNQCDASFTIEYVVYTANTLK